MLSLKGRSIGFRGSRTARCIRRRFRIARSRGTTSSVGLSCLLIAFAAIVCLVKTRPLKQQPTATADQSLEPAARASLGANCLATGRQRFGRDALELIKAMTTFLAFVFVCWHNGIPVRNKPNNIGFKEGDAISGDTLSVADRLVVHRDFGGRHQSVF